MITKTIIKQNAYYDSVRLMNMSSKLTKFQGIHEAVVIMGTKMNKQILDNSGLLTKEGDKAKESDLIIVIQGEEQDLLDNVINQIDELIIEKTKSESNIQSEFRTIREAIVQRPQSNLILISCPGMYAATEAYKALMNGINVFLFSNNVKIEDEILLKKMALHRGLYLMGPDCGTSIINGHPLGFANSVNRGTVAVVASDIKEEASIKVEGKKIIAKRDDGEINVSIDGQDVAGYYEMWFSWFSEHQEDGFIWDLKKRAA